ncbi:hypothetical protein G6F56_006285 [Rhizopus delemar]|uniref:Association with the SNF1 complex (ASC) domain-containing protein n=1 Tax=Rhizopus stolonifer TaxID=4846 RepID=A0A367IQS4_RHIST|nr:hypothetical protein G6F56_006285 [Rhizopus delemar]RCH80012.1 hypothetical protein CU098_002099 [Rhizopus stolonifer]
MGNTNSTESSIHQRTRSKSDSSSSSVANTIEIPAPTVTEPVNTPQLSITEPEESKEPVPKAVPVATGKSGWVSSTTGAASPWFNSLSSSTSSYHPHRASISGPYYRTRGMSVTRDSENDEDLSTSITQQANSGNMPIQGVPTIITWTQGGNNVYVTGTFNGWKNKIKLIKSTHDFNAVLELPSGTHRLKFIVDDEWKCSNDLETATDPDGNLVNYLQVMDDDEEEEEEEDDLASTTGSAQEDYYTSAIPPELLKMAEVSEGDIQAKPSIEWEKKQPQPPTLPPHLDKVLLNSQTVSEEDNSVLFEPNHVTLNHLYACSIKDNVLALATTTRYRKKYVTTMYYRPVSPKN